MTRRHDELLERLRALARRAAAAAGVELVEVRLRGSSRKRLIRVDIDRAGPVSVGIDDCRRVSQALDVELDAVDLFPGSYVLEVSSPGIDRPIRTADDFRRNTGRQVQVTLRTPLEDGRRQVTGTLLASDEHWVRLLEPPEGEVRIPLEQIETARQDVDF